MRNYCFVSVNYDLFVLFCAHSNNLDYTYMIYHNILTMFDLTFFKLA